MKAGRITLLMAISMIVMCFTMPFFVNHVLAATWHTEGNVYEFPSGQFLIKLASIQDSIYVDSVVTYHSGTLLSITNSQLWAVVAFDSSISVDSLIESLDEDESFLYVVPDIYIDEGAGCSPPSDTWYSEQWYLNNSGAFVGRKGADIKACDAWQIQDGSRSTKIAILDTGVPFVCDLPHPCDTSSTLALEDLGDFDKYDFGTNWTQLGFLPDVGSWAHGTEILSLIASEKDNSRGIAGLAPNVSVYVSRLYGGSKTTISKYGPAILEAINSGAKIINASWGRPYKSLEGETQNYFRDLFEDEVVKPCFDSSVLLVACAHNHPNEYINVPAALCQYGTYPGHEEGWNNVISVSGTDFFDSPFYVNSEFGNCKSDSVLRTWVSAPSEGLIVATVDMVNGDYVGNVKITSGTSFGTPLVVGLAALILSEDSTLTPDTVRQIIALTADKVWQDPTNYPDTFNTYVDPDTLTEWWVNDYWQWHPEYGFGRINCYEALRYLIWEDELSILPQDTTIWGPDTTIILHGDIVIGSGSTLIIDSGAVIRASSYDVTASGHADWLSEIIVAGGVLDINGTSTSPVSLVGKIDRPGQWYGIQVDSGTFTYDHLHMTNEFYDFRWDYTLDSNTTWSGTVTLRGDIVIPSGVTLTIEDSTTIEIENYDVSLYKGVDSSLIEIVVDGGTLRVNGSLANPVKFTYTDSQDSGKRVDWYGIRVKSGKCIMDYAEVRNAYAGVRMYDSTADTVTNSYFVDCGMYGLRIESDNALIQNSRISGVDPGYGIYVYQANPLIDSDSIWSCETGIYSSFGSDLTIDNVKIIGPGKYGAHLCSAGDTLTTVTVDDLSVRGQIEYAHLTLGSNGYFDVSYAILVSDTVVNDTIDRTPSIVNAGLPTKFKLRHSNLAEYGDQAFGIAFCDGRKWDLGTGSTNRGYNNISSSDTGAAYFNYSGEISGGNLMARYNWWGASPPSAYKFATSGTYSVDYSSYARAPYSKLTLEERSEVSPILPSNFSLDQNHPNPFNPSTMISYAIPVRGHVQLSIFNILGQRVRLLVDQEQQPGFHQSLWDGRDQTGREVASGIYLYRLDVANLFQQTKKMIMMK